MGHKTHPIGFRLGVIKGWQATWFAAKPAGYRDQVNEDLSFRKTILGGYPDAGISRIEIERGNNEAVVTIHTARPGIVIGRGGQRVEELRKQLEGMTDKRVRLNVQEIRQPELDAFLVARNIADQLERRIAFRRAMRQAVTRTMQAGAQGIKILVSGRLGGADIARREKAMEGRVPLHTLRADIDYSLAEAATEFGRIGVKVWIYKGEVLTARPVVSSEEEAEDILPIEVTLRAAEEESPRSQESQQAEPASGSVAVEDPPERTAPVAPQETVEEPETGTESDATTEES